MADARADLGVHLIEHARKQLRNEVRIAIGVANDEMLCFYAFPASKLLGELESKHRALIVGIKRDGSAQVGDGAVFEPILHREQPEFRRRNRPRWLALRRARKNLARLGVLAIQDKLTTANDERVGDSWLHEIGSIERCAHRSEVVSRGLNRGLPRKSFGKVHRRRLGAHDQRIERLHRRGWIVLNKIAVRIEKCRVRMHRVEPAQCSSRTGRAVEVELCDGEFARETPSVGAARTKPKRLTQCRRRILHGVAIGEKLGLAHANAWIKTIDLVARTRQRGKKRAVFTRRLRVETHAQHSELNGGENLLDIARVGQRIARRGILREFLRFGALAQCRQRLRAPRKQLEIDGLCCIIARMAIRRRAHLIRRREHLHMATCAQQRLDAQVQGHAGVHKRRIVQSPTLQRHSRASGWSVKVEIVEYAVQNAEILALAVGQVRRRDRLEHGRGRRDRLGKAAILRQRRS